MNEIKNKKTFDIVHICDLISRATKCPNCREVAELAKEEYEKLPLIIAECVQARANEMMTIFIEKHLPGIVEKTLEDAANGKLNKPILKRMERRTMNNELQQLIDELKRERQGLVDLHEECNNDRDIDNAIILQNSIRVVNDILKKVENYE